MLKLSWLCDKILLLPQFLMNSIDETKNWTFFFILGTPVPRRNKKGSKVVVTYPSRTLYFDVFLKIYEGKTVIRTTILSMSFLDKTRFWACFFIFLFGFRDQSSFLFRRGTLVPKMKQKSSVLVPSPQL